MKVFVLSTRFGTPRAFSSEKTLLEFFQQRNPTAKRLRIWRSTWIAGRCQVMNHNSHQGKLIERLNEIEVDESIHKAKEQEIENV